MVVLENLEFKGVCVLPPLSKQNILSSTLLIYSYIDRIREILEYAHFIRNFILQKCITFIGDTILRGGRGRCTGDRQGLF